MWNTDFHSLEFKVSPTTYIPNSYNRRCNRCGKLCEDWEALEDHQNSPIQAFCRSRKEKHIETFFIFHPDYPGLISARVSRDGETENIGLKNIIEAMRRGIYTEKAFDLRCVPDWGYDEGNILKAKADDCTTLGKLFAPKKARGSQVGLRTISEKDRYKGKVDWNSKRHQIAAWIGAGISLGKISKRLKVSPSTLSKANVRFGLYTPKERVAQKNPK